MARIAVVGGGAFGTAMACVLRRGGHEVTLWARGSSPRSPGARIVSFWRACRYRQEFFQQGIWPSSPTER